MTEKPKKNISTLLFLLLITVIIGVITIFLQHRYSHYKFDQLADQVENNQQRIRIGSYIVEDLKQVETDFFRFVTFRNPKSRQLIVNSLKNRLAEITSLLQVIEQGGNHIRLVPLNLAGQDTMTIKTHYQPNKERKFVGEILSLKSMLNDLKKKISRLVALLKNDNDSKNLTSDITFLRETESYFIRTHERANKLLYDSNLKLYALRQKIEEKERYYNMIDMVTGSLTLIIIMLLGGLISRKITLINLNLEEVVIQRSTELQRTHQQLLHSEKLGAIGRLSASIAHEINNPLFGIMTILGGLKKREELSNKGHDAVELALNECKRVKRLITNLQDFHRPTPGRFTPQAINQLIDEVLLLTNKEFKNQHLQIIREFTDDLPEIEVVADQIKQVLLNLLQNALVASPPNSDITITTKQIDNQLAISVKDQGCGITTENQPHIFEPFFTTKSEVKGTGLGLSVSFGIIKSHNGEIQVESKPDQGSIFTILLPIKRQ